MAQSPPLKTIRTLRVRPRRQPPRLLPGVARTRPRAYEEWKALAAWGQLPAPERRPPGYLLRLARERLGLTQAELAARLNLSQQAVARAERWESNPTVRLLEAWAQALGARLILELRFSDAERD